MEGRANVNIMDSAQDVSNGSNQLQEGSMSNEAASHSSNLVLNVASEEQGLIQPESNSMPRNDALSPSSSIAANPNMNSSHHSSDSSSVISTKSATSITAVHPAGNEWSYTTSNPFCKDPNWALTNRINAQTFFKPSSKKRSRRYRSHLRTKRQRRSSTSNVRAFPLDFRSGFNQDKTQAVAPIMPPSIGTPMNNIRYHPYSRNLWPIILSTTGLFNRNNVNRGYSPLVGNLFQNSNLSESCGSSTHYHVHL